MMQNNHYNPKEKAKYSYKYSTKLAIVICIPVAQNAFTSVLVKYLTHLDIHEKVHYKKY